MSAMAFSSLFTVYLGIFNGEKYLSSCRSQLLAQSSQEFQIVVIDNASTDDSWELLKKWKEDFGSRLSIYRNEINLGGGGSLARALNQGLISSEWFATMHQDDYYYSNHVQLLLDEIKRSPKEVVAICTGMSSMNFIGEKIPTPVRAMWLSDNYSSPDSFLLNLRAQSLSFPSSAFQREVFHKCFQYWHSPAFGDTEVTLRLCGHGEFRYITTETVAYRENPQSESHVVNLLESQMSASISLSRVFASVEFQKVLSEVKGNERALFFSELISALEVRIKDSPLLYLIQILASEECCRAWGYKEQQPLIILNEIYQAMNAQFTANLMSSLANEQPSRINQDLNLALSELSGRISATIFSKLSRPKSRVNVIFSKLPLKIRMKLFRFYVRIFAIKQPNHYWNAFWR
jgi:glycosyltransferase involved in cell wall biosynthesis